MIHDTGSILLRIERTISIIVFPVIFDKDAYIALLAISSRVAFPDSWYIFGILFSTALPACDTLDE